MCTQNENGLHPSCLEAQFDGPGAEENGLCFQCANDLHADKELFEKRWNDAMEELRAFDLMRMDGHRWLINADEAGFHLRRVALVKHDLERDEKVYTADLPLGTARTPEDLPRVIREALQTESAHQSDKK